MATDRTSPANEADIALSPAHRACGHQAADLAAEVWVEGQMHLLQLHHIIQAAMGWTDAHLHDFTIAGVRYSVPHPDHDFDLPLVDERTVRLDHVVKPGLTLEYQYDFGDS